MKLKMKDSVPKTLSTYVMDSVSDKDYVDFVAVGNQGANVKSHSDKDYLGSVANEIIRHTKLNVLFVA